MNLKDLTKRSLIEKVKVTDNFTILGSFIISSSIQLIEIKYDIQYLMRNISRELS